MTTTPPDNSEWIEELCKKFYDAGADSVLIDWKRNDVQAMYTEAKAQIIAKLREEWIRGQREITAMGRERMENDDTYTLDAWIEDSEVYLDNNSPQGEEAGTV